MKNLKKIWEYVKPYKWHAFGNISFNVIQIIFSLSSLALIIPFLGILFNQQDLVYDKPELSYSPESLINYFNYYISQIIIDEGKRTALLAVSIFVVIVVTLKNASVYIARFLMLPLRNGIILDIRNNIYKKILKLPLAYYTNERKGDIISKISNDVKEIEWSIVRSIEAASRDPLTILFYFVTLVIMSPQLTVFLLILLPVSGIIIGLVGKSLRRDSKKAQTLLGNLISNIEETLSGMRVIKAFNAENVSMDRFKLINRLYTRIMIKMGRRKEMASPLSELLGVIIMVIIMFYGGSMVLNNESNLTPSEFIGYIVIFSQIINPAKKFSTAFYDIKKGLASIDRISVILRAEEKIVDSTDAKEIAHINSSVEFKNVSFKYDENYVLRNINLKIEKGQTVALVGQSGSGKTTLADLIPRFYDIEEGEILFDGINIKDLKISNLRELIGYVNQEPVLFNDTIFNNIAFGIEENVNPDDVIHAAHVANAHDFISENENGYDSNIGDSGVKLSGGQRQRISIARAVLKNPPLLILDEATSSLDTESEKLVQDALDNLMKNRTSVVIAHRLSTIKNADVIYVLNEGEIVESGNHKELILKNGVYKKLHDLQIF